MIASVVGQYYWTPGEIDKLYLDEINHHGLIYWYDRVVEIVEEMKKKTKNE